MVKRWCPAASPGNISRCAEMCLAVVVEAAVVVVETAGQLDLLKTMGRKPPGKVHVR